MNTGWTKTGRTTYITEQFYTTMNPLTHWYPRCVSIQRFWNSTFHKIALYRIRNIIICLLYMDDSLTCSDSYCLTSQADSYLLSDDSKEKHCEQKNAKKKILDFFSSKCLFSGFSLLLESFKIYTEIFFCRFAFCHLLHRATRHVYLPQRIFLDFPLYLHLLPCHF